MKIAIQSTPIGFTDRWIAYCEDNNISYKLVDCYKNDILNQLKDCDALMWHHNLLQKKDNLIAKRLLTAVEHAGKIVFPSIYENWHYDDKIAQKYLLEAIGAPLVPTFVFYDKKEALQWAHATTFPKVFKLKGGAGSINVRLVRTKSEAVRLINKAFAKGFDPVSKKYFLQEAFRKFKNGKINFIGLLKGFYRYMKPADKNFVNERQVDYVYFQDFIPGNDADYRVVVINQNRAFGLKRYNRENDFRASGSGNAEYLKPTNVSERIIKTALLTAAQLKMSSVAFDIVLDADGNPLIIEITYAYGSKVNNCPGYWDENLIWNETRFKHQHWMMDNVINRLNER